MAILTKIYFMMCSGFLASSFVSPGPMVLAGLAVSLLGLGYYVFNRPQRPIKIGGKDTPPTILEDLIRERNRLEAVVASQAAEIEQLKDRLESAPVAQAVEIQAAKIQPVSDEELKQFSSEAAGTIEALVGQLLVAVSEAEEAIATAVSAFYEASEHATKITDVAKGALRQSDQEVVVIEDLSRRSSAIGESLNTVMTAFQFQDLLRQRLEYVALGLFNLRQEIARVGNIEAEPLSMQLSGVPFVPPTLSVVSYEGESDNVELFG